MFFNKSEFCPLFGPKTKCSRDMNFPSKGKQMIIFFVTMPSCH